VVFYFLKECGMVEARKQENEPNPDELVKIAQELLEGKPQIPGDGFTKKFNHRPVWRSMLRALVKLPELPLYGPDYIEQAFPATEFYARKESERQVSQTLQQSLVRTYLNRTGWVDYLVRGYQPARLVDGSVVPDQASTESLYSVRDVHWDSEGRHSSPNELVIFGREGAVFRRNANREIQAAIDQNLTPDEMPNNNGYVFELNSLKVAADLLSQARV
jgi:hypothetical protein